MKKNLKIKQDTDNIMKKPEHNIVQGAKNNDLKEVRAALTENPDCINAQDPESGMTALHWAGNNASLRVATELFKCKNLNPEIEDFWKRLPLDFAIACGRHEVINLFLSKIYPNLVECETDNISILHPSDFPSPDDNF